MKYNDLPSDIRLVKTSKEDAVTILHRLEGKWVSIKLIVKKNTADSMDDYVVNYTKFKISQVDSSSEFIFLYGIEDEDRVIIAADEIVQTEKSSRNDEVLIRLKNHTITTDIYLKSFVPNKERLLRDLINSNQNLIITEGKTDWKHLKAAFRKLRAQGLYSGLKFEFWEYQDSLTDYNTQLQDKKLSGASTLNIICQYTALFPNDKLRIFLFDSDREDINRQYRTDQGYCYLGNHVYAVILPLPEFRKNTPAISIENYYTDDEIKTKDRHNKRLYLGSEFISKEETPGGKLYSLKAREAMPNLVIDDEVYIDRHHLKIWDKNQLKSFIEQGRLEKVHTLSKNEFADNILHDVPGFNMISKDNFRLVFDVIETIFEVSKNTSTDRGLGLLERKNIQQGVEIEFYQTHQELHLYLGLPNDRIQALRNNSLLTGCAAAGNNKIKLFINGIEMLLSLSSDLFLFLVKKSENINHRIYLNLMNEKDNYVCSFEIFQGGMGCMQMERLIKQLEMGGGNSPRTN